MKIDLSKITSSTQRLTILLIITALLGAVWFVMIRAVFIDVGGPHYHANFALYVDGKQELFTEGVFYEEVAACGGSEIDPKSRVHLHDFVGDVVHVHDATSTWSHFFENLGFALSTNVLVARNQTYVDGDGGSLRFILNGEEIQSITGRTIKNEDVMLISYGSEDTETLMNRYNLINQNADEYNAVADPAACTGSQDYSYWQRIQAVLGID